jgi:hypothetical protein
MSDFDKIEKWLSKKGFTIRFGKSDLVDYDKNEVVLIRNQKKSHLIFTLLHECGHIRIGSKKSFSKKFKDIIKADLDGRHERSYIYRYKKLREEIDAWESGYKLSKKLRIKIDKDIYDDYAARCFNTYVKL